MDSDEEEVQLKKAIKASKTAAPKGKAKGKATAKPTPQALGGKFKKGNGRALTAAVARAAESESSFNNQLPQLNVSQDRARAGRGEATPSSLESPKEPTPSSNDGESEFEGSQLSEAESDLSALSAEPEDSDLSNDSKASVPMRHAGQKRKWKGKGKGVRLHGGLVADEGVDFSTMTEEEKQMTIFKMREKGRLERKAWEEARAPLKKKEVELKNQLGRKLTNGERNFIALSYVSGRHGASV